MSPRRVIFRSYQSPGDVVMLTPAVRDLHLAHPGKFQTDVCTSADVLWQHNPYITPLNEQEPGVETIECHYPFIHQANSRPYHFIHGYAQFLEQRLGVPIPLTRFAGDIHLSEEEKHRPLAFTELGLKHGFWIIIAGGKYDFTAKWWDPAGCQAVVDHFQGRIQFAQCGEAGHWHPRLKGVVDLVGRTNLRDFVLLMYHASGVLCPVTFAMHLAAAVPMKGQRKQGTGNSSVGNGLRGIPNVRTRPCVVIAGAREPAHWEQYPGHQFLHTLGSLPCCLNDPCWRSRCQLVGDGDEKDRRDVCERPVQLTPDLRIPECMAAITPDDVIRAIERYMECGDSSPLSPVAKRPSLANVQAAPRQSKAAINRTHSKSVPVLIDFRHGLGDAVQLTTVLRHLRHYHPDWQIDVAAGIGKLPVIGHREQSAEKERVVRSQESELAAAPDSSLVAHHSLLYDRFLIRGRDPIDRAAYQQVFEVGWDECRTCYADSPSTKAEHCLRTVFNLMPIRELCRYELAVGADAWAAAKSYLESICGVDAAGNGRYPVVLLHYQGNTSSDKKDLPHELARHVCEVAIDSGHVPVILDRDRRTPLADGARIFNPSADSPLWGGSGTGECEVLAALIAQSSLFIGVDSGPLHVAGAVSVGNALCGVPPFVDRDDKETRGQGDKENGRPIQNPKSKIQNPPTPVIAVWTGHHPLHYFGLAEHVTHLVPEDHASRLRGNPATGLSFFEKHYDHRAYQRLDDALPALVQEVLARDTDGLLRVRGFWVRGDNVEQDLVIVRDIAEQDSYRIAELDVPGPVALDVGAHIGVFSRAFKRRHPSARVVAVECCPENIAALRRNVADFAAIVAAFRRRAQRFVAALHRQRPHRIFAVPTLFVSLRERAANFRLRTRLNLCTLRVLPFQGRHHVSTPTAGIHRWLDRRQLSRL